MKIGFIGLGKLGLPVAEVMSKHYYVEGFDIDPKFTDCFKTVISYEQVVKNKDLIFVAVQTPHEKDFGGEQPSTHLPPTDFDYTYVQDVLKNIDPYVNENSIIVIISTVLPGTTREKFAPLLSKAKIVYNPYLIAMGSVKWDMINPEMIIIGTDQGGVNPESEKLINFYKKFIDGARYELGTFDEAESIKIFYNTFISTKISLVNMIQDVAVKNGNIDTDIVTGALAKSNYRITGSAYMKAGMGDGGPCHPRDNIALRYLSQRLDLGYDLFGSIMQSREKQAENLAEYLMSFDLPIVIYGITYKSFVEYTDGSYSLLVKSFIDSKNYSCEIIDPNLKINKELNTPHTILISYHDSNLKDLNFPKGSIIVDPWRQFPNNKDYKVIHYGNTRVNVS